MARRCGWREAVAERRAVAAVFARAAQQDKVFAFVKWRGTAAAAAARPRLLHRAAAALQARGMRNRVQYVDGGGGGRARRRHG